MFDINEIKKTFCDPGHELPKKMPGDLLSVFKAGEGPWQKHLINRNMQLGRPQAIIGTEDLLLRCSAKSCSVSQKTIATYSSPNSSI